MTQDKLIELFKSYISVIDRSPGGFSTGDFGRLFGEVCGIVDANYGKTELDKVLSFRKDDDYLHKTAAGKVKGYLLGQIIKLEKGSTTEQQALIRQTDDKQASSPRANSIQANNSPQAISIQASVRQSESRQASVREAAKPTVAFPTPPPAKVTPSLAKPQDSKKVFIVHGHDDLAKNEVEVFLIKLGLEPIILHNQPNNGKTIIEKFESFAEKIAFAVVLLTPDDVASPRANPKDEKFRARQNVIYELGFFNAKLGRDRVCVIKKGDIEVLSDYLGVIYVEMDSGGAWRNQLVREIEASGLSINPENLKTALLS